ncbi:hypothetical protein PanWU01x14_184530 [Parasponia andersonii]|uniref:Uncharacterized protein n=1 Tax=Parasponia andersonii TaxID=3476 RepID=A0A2P5C4M8_PARAD|nr:hypothetical protein PanWU01x14_184530 [Parasponia andersonii]
MSTDYKHLLAVVRPGPTFQDRVEVFIRLKVTTSMSRRINLSKSRRINQTPSLSTRLRICSIKATPT